MRKRVYFEFDKTQRRETMLPFNKHFRALSSAVALGGVAFLGGCAAQPPSFGYQGSVSHGALSGQSITMTTRFEDADFTAFKNSPDHPQHAGDWVMTPLAVAGVFNNELSSALEQEGATVPSSASQAQVVIHVTMTPTKGHRHLVWTQYQMGKSVAMGMIPLTHSNYFIQHDHLLEKISIEKAGHVIAQKTIQVDADVPYKSSTLEGGAQEMDGLRIYRDQQAAAVQQILAMLTPEGS